ncbi:hypothetical protein [Allohahella marinimesophila]|uniref:Restart primosome assembly protein PriC n=1 Tax=Allohahella marinimesophila TaxID=1054972 RepID=A0ABP7NUX5_9GAMM
MSRAGRPKKTTLEKLKSAASRAYREWQRSLTCEFADEHDDKRVQIANDNAGRPPKELSKIRFEAEQKYNKALAEFRAFETDNSMDHCSEDSIIEFAKDESPGRKAHDKITYLKKYIRRVQMQISHAEQVYEQEQLSGPGRKPMSKAEKIEYLNNKISKAEAEIAPLYNKLPTHEKVWLELNDVRIEARQLRLFLKGSGQAKHVYMTKEEAETRLAKANDEIFELEQIYSEEEREHRKYMRYLEKRDNREEKAARLLIQQKKLEEQLDSIREDIERLNTKKSDIAV